MVISDFFHLRLGASVGGGGAFPTGPSQDLSVVIPQVLASKQ